MLNVPLDRIITVTEARDNFAKVVDGAKSGEIYVLTKGGRPCVAVVDIRFLEESTGQRLNTQVMTVGAFNSALSDKEIGEEKKPALQAEKVEEKIIEPINDRVIDQPKIETKLTDQVMPSQSRKESEEKKDSSEMPDFREFSDLNEPSSQSTFSIPSADTIKSGEAKPTTSSAVPPAPPEQSAMPKAPSPFTPVGLNRPPSTPISPSTSSSVQTPTPPAPTTPPIPKEEVNPSPKTTNIPINPQPSPTPANPTPNLGNTLVSPTPPTNAPAANQPIPPSVQQPTPIPPKNNSQELDDLDIG